MFCAPGTAYKHFAGSGQITHNMAQGPLKPRKQAGKPATQRRNKPKVCHNAFKNPAVRKLRKVSGNLRSVSLQMTFLIVCFQVSKLVTVGKIEKLMVSTASANNEHLVYVQKPSKSKSQPEPASSEVSPDVLMD